MTQKILKKFLSEEVINYFDDQIEAVEQSVLDEKSRAEGQEAAIRSEFAAADAQVLAESKSYTDAEVLAEKTRAESAELALQGEIDAEELLRASEDVRILSESKSYTDEKVLAEKTRALAAEAGLQTEIDNLESYVDATFVTLASKGQPNGVATLNEAGLIPQSQLPSYVDDVLEYPTLAQFPVLGEMGKIYVDVTTSKCYRWSGSTYIQITSGAVDTVFGRTGVITAQAGDYSADQITYGMGFVSDAIQNLESEIENEKSVRQFADQNLQFEIDAEEQRALAAEQFIEGLITTETQNRFNADQFIQSELDATQLGAGLAIDGSYQPHGLASSSIFGATSLFDADVKLDAALSNEKFLRETADQELQSDIDAERVRALAAEADLAEQILLGDQTEALNRATAIALALEEAKEYTDEQIAEIKSDLDSLELSVQELRSDVNEHELRIVEVESKHVPVPKQKFFLIDETSELSYLDLGELAMDQSLVVFYNINVIRPVHHFTVSVVNGQTRLTWVNSLVPGQDMGVEVGDEFFVSYMV